MTEQPAPGATNDPGFPDAVTLTTDATSPAAATERKGSGPTPYVPAFDGFRGLGSIVVLCGHSGWLTGSWLAVDMFFVLSGYLITSLLLVEHTQSAGGRLNLRRFWSRRVRRLGPAMILTVVGIGAYAAWVAPETQRYDIRWDGFATLFEVMNWRMIVTGNDYWHQFGPASPLKHAWSLSIEEQLYLFWPIALVLVLAWRKRIGAVTTLAAVGVVASVATSFWLVSRGAPIERIYQGTDTRSASMLLGCALAGVRLQAGAARWKRSHRLRVTLGTAAAIPLAWFWVTLDPTARSTYRGLLPLTALLATIVIAGISDPRRGGPVGRLFDLPPFVWLGRLSFGLYLFHWPIFLWLDDARTGLDGIALFLLRSSISVAAAWASYRWIEGPIRHGALKGRQARAAVPAAMSIAVLALLLGTYGAQPRPSSEWNNYLYRSTVPGAPTIELAGDSVPMMLGLELATQVDELGVNVGSVAVPGCHLLSSIGEVRDPEGRIRDDAGCGKPGRFRDGTLAYRPDVSVVLFGRLQNDEVKIDGTWRMPCEPAYMTAYRAKLIETIHDLEVTGGKVVLVSTPPSSVQWVVDAAPPGMFERIRCMNDQLREIADELPNVGFVDLAGFICPEPTRCKDKIDGIDLRPDTTHFEGESAALVNRWLIPRVLDAAKNA